MDGELDVDRARRPRSAWASTRPTSAASSTREIAESVDAYYQEVGRAGRDGEPAEAVLFYRREDLGLRRFFAGAGQVEVDEIAQVARRRARARRPGRARPSCSEETDLSRDQAHHGASRRLEEAGAVEVLPDGEVARAGRARRAARGDRAAAEAEEKRARVRPLARGHDARLRRDRRLPPRVRARRTSASRSTARAATATTARRAARGRARRRTVPFAVGSRVAHASGARASVQRYEDDRSSCCSTRSATRRSRSRWSRSAGCWRRPRRPAGGPRRARGVAQPRAPGMPGSRAYMAAGGCDRHTKWQAWP